MSDAVKRAFGVTDADLLGDIWPPNVMMSDDLQVAGLIDFSFTTRVGDHVMDLAGACHFLLATKASSQADHDYLKGPIKGFDAP